MMVGAATGRPPVRNTITSTKHEARGSKHEAKNTRRNKNEKED